MPSITRQQLLSRMQDEGNFYTFKTAGYHCYVCRSWNGIWQGYVELPADHPLYAAQHDQTVYVSARYLDCPYILKSGWRVTLLTRDVIYKRVNAGNERSYPLNWLFPTTNMLDYSGPYVEQVQSPALVTATDGLLNARTELIHTTGKAWYHGYSNPQQGALIPLTFFTEGIDKTELEYTTKQDMIADVTTVAEGMHQLNEYIIYLK